MEIPLPKRAWWVTFTRKCNYDNSPLGKDFDKYNLNLNEEQFPEVYVSPSFSRRKLKNDSRVLRLETVWYFTEYQITRPNDEVVPIEEFFYELLGGQLVSNCFGAARVYTTRRAALANLAKCDLGVESVYQAAKIRTGPIGALAKAVLAGDMSALPPLADALMEADHPLAEKIRELALPREKKKRSRKKK